ncbi:MAG: cytochrome c biogenesis protein CcdA, partial [Bacteroidota bacterium]
AASIPAESRGAVQLVAPGDDYSNLEPECGEIEADPDKGWLTIFILGFLGGFAALLTPCVFPMIPLTVSFFTKQSENRKKGIANASIYALSIIAIYVGLGLLVTVIAGPYALNEMASNGYFNMAFFLIFVVFAISFFGAFEITLPTSWVNKADSAADKGGLVGIFFMAFTLVLVSFSCTGPIIGTLLVEAAVQGSRVGPMMGMLGFSLSLALPFALFAAFPGWLNSLPQSGGWLNTVKVTLGFLELALALKFLSVVDLAYHWDFLYREIFLALWIVIFGMLGLYLLGKIKLPHDSDESRVSVPRVLLALLSLGFAIYMIPGLWGAPVKILSGVAPPSFHKEWTTATSNHCPHDLNCFHDLEEGMAYAEAQGKPVLLDFTGWSCVNCRKMEDNVWSRPEILRKLADDYVLISLYVDDKERLPEAEQYVS